MFRRTNSDLPAPVRRSSALGSMMLCAAVLCGFAASSAARGPTSSPTLQEAAPGAGRTAAGRSLQAVSPQVATPRASTGEAGDSGPAAPPAFVPPPPFVGSSGDAGGGFVDEGSDGGGLPDGVFAPSDPFSGAPGPGDGFGAPSTPVEPFGVSPEPFGAALDPQSVGAEAARLAAEELAGDPLAGPGLGAPFAGAGFDGSRPDLEGLIRELSALVAAQQQPMPADLSWSGEAETWRSVPPSRLEIEPQPPAAPPPPLRP